MIRDIFNFLMDNQVIRCAFAVLIGFLLLGVGFTMLNISNPTTTYQKQITISERQVLSSPLVRDYYVVTPENIWYQCNEFNNTWNQLQPGHTYNVKIRTSAPRGWLYNKNMNNETLNKTSKIDKSTNIYNYEMIVGVDGEVK